MSPVVIPYPELLASPEALLPRLEAAFGSAPGSLGIVLISDLPPHFPAAREKLFFLANAFAGLPEEVRERHARKETSYLFGWSHGKEVMNGRPDKQKGSYYANPLLDNPDVSDAKRAAHPEYYHGNVWPTDVPEMADFEMAFKALGKLVYDVGIALARACEPFVAEAINSTQKKSIELLISSSQSNKARLLHYFPEVPSTESKSEGETDQTVLDALCGTHLDHSLLTGLCSAMYLSSPTTGAAPHVVDPPSSSAGLYIYPRGISPSSAKGGEGAMKVQIPKDCLAFQTGEALELLTAGKLAATPHFVSGNANSSASESQLVSRETFAFFLQPDVDDVIGEGEHGETFGAFTKRVLGRHYQDQTQPKEAEAEG